MNTTDFEAGNAIVINFFERLIEYKEADARLIKDLATTAFDNQQVTISALFQQALENQLQKIINKPILISSACNFDENCAFAILPSEIINIISGNLFGKITHAKDAFKGDCGTMVFKILQKMDDYRNWYAIPHSPLSVSRAAQTNTMSAMALCAGLTLAWKRPELATQLVEKDAFKDI